MDTLLIFLATAHVSQISPRSPCPYAHCRCLARSSVRALPHCLQAGHAHLPMFGGGIPYGMMNAIGGGGRRRGGNDPWFLMMAFQLYQQIERLGPNKPKLTLGFMVLLAATHFNVLGSLSPLAMLGVFYPRDACLSPRRIFSISRKSWSGLMSLLPGSSGNNFSSFKVGGGEWYRIISSVFVFHDDVHLVVNLSSFLLQGVRLENKFGLIRFAKFLVIIFLATQIGFVALAETLRQLNVLDVTRGCIAGISGLNFALKSYLSITEPGPVHMWGFVIPGKWATVAELTIIQLLNPHAPSLVYHGIGALIGVTAAMWEGTNLRRNLRYYRVWKERVRNMFRGNRPRPDPPPGVREVNAAAARAAESHASGFGSFFRNGLRRRRTAPAAASSQTAESLKPGTRVVLAGLRAVDMNGSWGVVAGPDAKASGRVRVLLDTGSEFSLLPEKCVVVVTDEVRSR